MYKEKMLKVLRYILIMLIILEVILDYAWLTGVIIILIAIYIILRIYMVVKK